METTATAPTADALLDALKVDIYRILRIGPTSRIRFAVDRLTRAPLERFCHAFAETDRRMAVDGFCSASGWLARTHLVKDIHARGQARVPQTGPLLVVSNHPGASDSVCISTSLGRDDLKIIASDVPFLKRLPTISQHLIFVAEDPAIRMSVIRAGLRHLQEGGAILIFPTGLIDPDPEFMPGSEAVMDTWSNSVEIFLRKVPAALLQPVIASGVLHPKIIRHPLTWIERERWKRQRIAEFLQLATQMLFPGRYPVEPKITFGEPVKIEAEKGRVKDQVVAIEKDLLRSHRMPAAGLPA